MNYQDELINQAILRLENAIIDHIKQPCIHNAQKVAEAKHAIVKLMKQGISCKDF